MPCLWVSGTLSSSQWVFPTHYSRLLLPTALWPHDADRQLSLDPFLALHLTLPWVISSWQTSRVIVYSPYFTVSGPTGLLNAPLKDPHVLLPLSFLVKQSGFQASSVLGIGVSRTHIARLVGFFVAYSGVLYFPIGILAPQIVVAILDLRFSSQISYSLFSLPSCHFTMKKI